MATSNPSPSALELNPVLLAESFIGTAFGSNQWVLGTSRFNRNLPILTASSGIDTPGSGALRLTGGIPQQAGFALYNRAVSTSEGLSITFDFASYGGTGGDGLSFFLVDGTTTPSFSGAPGGSLGYATSRYSDHPGLAGAYVGIGFDEFGGFSDPENSAIGGPGSRPDSISVRGSAQNAYRYLTGSNSRGIDSANRTYHRTQIDLSAAGVLNVSIDLNGDLDFNDAGEAAIKDFNLVATNKALPGTVKLGFTAAAGDKTNIHEIRNLSVASTKPLGSFDLGSITSTLTYTENQPGLTVAGSSTIALGGKQLDQVGVRIQGNYVAGQDILTIAGQTGTQGTINGLSWVFRPATGGLVISGNGTVDAYQAALRQVTYLNNSDNPDIKPRTVELSLLAKDGTTLAKNATLNVLAVNDAPSLRVITQEGVESGALGATVGPVFVTDPDNTYNLTVSDSRFEIVSNGPNSGLLKLRAGQGLTRPTDITITGTDNSTSPAITFSQRLTVGVYSIPNPGGAITVGGLSSNAPIVYNVISTPLPIARGLILGGGGGGNVDGAIVKIVGTGFNAGKERLGLPGSTANSGTINGLNWVYTPATGTLTFSGPAPLAAYQNALSQVTYSAGSGSRGDRAIQFIVGNGANAGAGNLVVTFGNNNGTPDSTLGGPTAISLTDRIVPPGIAAGAVVGTVTVTDPDSTSFNYALSDPRFEVVNGQLKLKSGQTIAAPVDLSITAYDGVIGAAGTQSFTQVFNLVPRLPEIFLRDYSTTAASALFYINNARDLAGVRYLSNDGRQDEANRFNLPTKWRAEAVGDINRDGFNDVVYRNTTNGEASAYIAFLGEGGRIIGQDYVKFQNQLLQTEDNANWQIRGLSDMDGNGTLELVWHNAQLDRTALWYLPSDGTTNLTDAKFVTRGTAIAGLQSPGTNLVGVGDFDADGKSELLFRNNLTDRTTLWKLNAATVVQEQLLISTGQSSWQIKLVADFNNDGRADIAWQNTSSGQSAIWLSAPGPTGTITVTAANSFFLPAPGANWSFEAAADFNNDGTNDIVLRNKVDDTLRIWTIRGGQFGADNLIQNGTSTFVLGSREWDVEGAGQFGATPA